MLRHDHRPVARRPTRRAAPLPVVAPEVRRCLLELARVALAVATGRADVSALGRALETRSGRDAAAPGVFVTLSEVGALRGCVGSLGSDRPLREAVAASAICAALDDPRFTPVTAEELSAVHVEISVLGAPTPIASTAAFRPGVDGVIVERDGRQGLLLPEVATVAGLSATQMFDAACQKAGLPDDAWREPSTRLRSFRTVRFGGPATRTD
jgi:AmmeMemoRadiSam system protein A